MLTIRKALALSAVTVAAAGAAALAVPVHTSPDTGRDPYAPSYVVTTAEQPPRWAILDNGVKWNLDGTPFVVCVLNTGDDVRPTRTVPVATTTWRTASPITWTPGANCPG